MIKGIFQLDWLLIFLIMALFGVGLVALYSAGGEVYFQTQLLRGIVGVVLMLAIAYTPFTWVRHSSIIAFVIVIVMLFLVLVWGVKVNNARRWLDIGFYVQPSELMKILLPLGLAYMYCSLPEVRWWHHLLALLIVAIPVLAVFKQPDFGTAVLIVISGVATVFFSGMRLMWIGGLSVFALSLLPFVWKFLLKPYQQKRVLTMLDPYQDPLGAGYHTIQSQIAVGSGGIWGKGFQSGTQAQLGFLPERHTDFIFAVFAEEFGLVGSIILLGLGVLITLRLLYIIGTAKSRFGAFAIGGIMAVFFLTFVINLSMVSGLLPVVGMPLPLVSYGGTALISTFLGFGFVLAVARDTALKNRRR